MNKGPLEDTLPSLRRRRLIQQLEIPSHVMLSIEQSSAVDELLKLCPEIDTPAPLQLIAEYDRPAAVSFLKQLPSTHVSTRILEDGRWPQ